MDKAGDTKMKLVNEPFVSAWHNNGSSVSQKGDDSALFDTYVRIGRKIGFLKPRKDRYGRVLINLESPKFVIDEYGRTFSATEEDIEYILTQLFSLNGNRSELLSQVQEALESFEIYNYLEHLDALSAKGKVERRQSVYPYQVIPRF